MPAQIMLVRQGRTLVPADGLSEDELRALPEGEIVRAKVSRPRNPRHHRKFFALLQVVYRHQSRYPTIEGLLDAIKIAIGHYDVHRLGGKDLIKPRSIAFASMDQAAFTAFYDRVVLLILEHMLPGVAQEDLERQVLEILDGRRA